MSTLAMARSSSGVDWGTSLFSWAHGMTPWLCGRDSSRVEVGFDRAPWSSPHKDVPALLASFWVWAPQTPVHGSPDTTSMSSPTAMNAPV